MPRSDQELLASIASGDQAAFAEFYDRHAARVLGGILQLLGRRGDSEDVLQETFCQVWRSAGQYDPTRSSPRTWLYLISRSRGTDHLRQQRPRLALSAGHEPATMDDPGSALERSEGCRCLRAALARLPDEQQAALTLAFFGGLTNEEVARDQGVPLGTAKTRIRLAMKRLRCLLGDCGRSGP